MSPLDTRAKLCRRKLSTARLCWRRCKVGGIVMADEFPQLGEQVRDTGTGIDGQFIAVTKWHDRSSEAAILREVRA